MTILKSLTESPGPTLRRAGEVVAERTAGEVREHRDELLLLLWTIAFVACVGMIAVILLTA